MAGKPSGSPPTGLLWALQEHPLKTKSALEFFVRMLSGLTGQLILHKRVVNLNETLVFGVYGALITGPFNAKANDVTAIIARKTRNCMVAKLAWSNLFHLPALQGILIAYKAWWESFNRGDSAAETLSNIKRTLAAGWFATLKAVWPINIPCTLLVNLLVPLNLHMQAYQIMAYFTTTINVVKAAAAAKKAEQEKKKE